MATITTAPPIARSYAAVTRWKVLVGAIIVQLILGTVYGYSIFWQPLEADVFPPIATQAEITQMTASGESVAGITVVADAAAATALHETQRGYLKYAFSICILSFALVMVLAGRVQDKKGPRYTATIGAALMGSGFLIAGLMNTQIVFFLAHAAFTGVVGFLLLMAFHAFFGKNGDSSPLVTYAPMAIIASVIVAGVALGNNYVGRSGELDKLFLLWGTVGFLAGSGIGFAYVCPIAALIKWFPEHKGLVSGIAVAGFGFGAYLFSSKDLGFGATGYIAENGIQSMFLVHGIVCLIGVSIGAMLLSNPPGTVAKAVVEVEWQEILRQGSFYMLWLMFFSGALAGLMVIGITKDFAGEQLVSSAGGAGAMDAAARDALLLKGAAAVGWLSIFNAIGRVGWGLLSDRVGRTLAFVALFVFQAVMMFVLSGMNTELSLGVAASIVGFNFGGCFALFPSATADLFGSKNLGANYGLVFTSYGIAGVVGIFAGNTAKILTGSYGAAFALSGGLCIVSAVLAIALYVSRKTAALAA